MDLQARLNLRDHEKRKVVVRNADGAIVAMMALQEPASFSGGPLDELQRSLDADDEMRRRFGRRLVVADATPEEVTAFERSRHRVN
jgi:hypothetical protein